MSFGLGFVTLFISLIWRLFVTYGEFGGKGATVDDVPCRYKTIRTRYGITHLRIAIDCDKDLRCEFRHETGFHRLFKQIGLTKEHQTGNAEFDQKIYILSDSTAVQTLMSQSAVVAQSITALMNSEKQSGQFEELVIQNGDMYVEYKLLGDAEPKDLTPRLAELSVPLMHAIQQEFQRATLPTPKYWMDAIGWRATTLSILFTSLAASAAFQFYAFQKKLGIQLTDHCRLFDDSLLLSACLSALALVLTIGLLGRTSRAHKSVLEALLIGSFAIWGNVYIAMKELTFGLDATPSQTVMATVTDKTMKKGSKGSKTYSLELRLPNDPVTSRINVHSHFFNQTSPGSTVELKVKQGRLGYPWIEEIYVQSKP